jgi:hypothetical protein
MYVMYTDVPFPCPCPQALLLIFGESPHTQRVSVGTGTKREEIRAKVREKGARVIRNMVISPVLYLIIYYSHSL